MAADALRSVTCSNASLIALRSSPPSPYPPSSRHSATLHQIFLSPQTTPFISCLDDTPACPCTDCLFLLPSVVNGRDVIRARGTQRRPTSVVAFRDKNSIDVVPQALFWRQCFGGKNNMREILQCRQLKIQRKMHQCCTLVVIDIILYQTDTWSIGNKNAIKFAYTIKYLCDFQWN